MSDFPPSEEQAAIISAASAGKNIKVPAFAGCGKTTLLRMLAEATPGKNYRYVVFNSDTQGEAKMGQNVSTRTGNSIAWSFMLEVYRQLGLDMPNRFSGKTGQLVTNTDIAKYFKIEKYLVVESKKTRLSGGNYELVDVERTLTPVQAVSHLKKAVVNFCISWDPELNISHFPTDVSYPPEAVSDAKNLWVDLVSPYGVQKLSHDAAVKIWALSKPDLSISDKDASTRYDALLLDEAQDTNPVFAKVYRDQRCQKVYVGDTNQAIYGFRGAHDELDKVEVDVVLPLTKTWRFGENLAKAPNAFLKALGSKSFIVSGKKSPGKVMASGTMTTPDVIICRTNAGVIRAIFEILDSGQKVSVPKKYVTSLINLLKTVGWFYGYSSEKPFPVHSDLEAYATREELDQAIEEGELVGKITTLIKLIDSHGYDALLVRLGLVNALSKKNVITIVTAHGAKGKEWDKVQIYDDFWGYKYDYLTGEYVLPGREELNLAYVATSRAMEEIDLGSLDYIMTGPPDASNYRARSSVEVSEVAAHRLEISS